MYEYGTPVVNDLASFPIASLHIALFNLLFLLSFRRDIMHYCAYCKIPLAPGATRCPRCDRKVEEGPAYAPYKPFVQSTPVTPYPSSSMQQAPETQTPGIATLTRPPQPAPRWVVLTVVLMASLLMLS